MSTEIITTTDQREMMATEMVSLVLDAPRPADRDPARAYLAGLQSPRSRRTMSGDLNKIAKLLGVPEAKIELEAETDDKRHRTAEDVTYIMCNWPALTISHTAAIRARLTEMYKPSTVNRMQTAIRQALEWSYDLGLITHEQYRSAIKPLKTINFTALPAGRALNGGEIDALVKACMSDPSDAGVRDSAIIAVLYTAGLRRAELVGLDLADYNGDACELKIRHGKGDKERFVYVDNGAADALADWLVVRGDADGPLFHPIRKGGRIQHGQRLTTEAIWHMLKRRADIAGVSNFSPHDFRRTCLTDLWAKGVPGPVIQKIAGHESIETTARYDRSDEEAKREASGMLHVPYRRRYGTRRERRGAS